MNFALDFLLNKALVSSIKLVELGRQVARSISSEVRNNAAFQLRASQRCVVGASVLQSHLAAYVHRHAVRSGAEELLRTVVVKLLIVKQQRHLKAARCAVDLPSFFLELFKLLLVFLFELLFKFLVLSLYHYRHGKQNCQKEN